MSSKIDRIFFKPYIIAEIGVNYYDVARENSITPMDAAKLMIGEAHRGGADSAKFQSYKADKLASVHSPAYWDRKEEPTDSQHALFKKFDHFGAEEYNELANHCDEVGIDFLSTPFDLEAVEFLDESMRYFKVASADITNLPLIRAVARKNKPILLSTGASTMTEVRRTVEEIRAINADASIVLMHCILSYPTMNKDANLYRIKLLKEMFIGCEVGYSDHTLPDEHMMITSAAFALGATVIEKHFTLNKKLKGNDHYHAMDVKDLMTLRNNLNLLHDILSSREENYMACEEESRRQARRSLVAARDISIGTILKEDDIICKRPGTGIDPMQIESVVGKMAKIDIKRDEILKWEMFL